MTCGRKKLEYYSGWLVYDFQFSIPDIPSHIFTEYKYSSIKVLLSPFCLFLPMFRKKSSTHVSCFSFSVRGDSLDIPSSNAENVLQDLITIAVVALLRALFFKRLSDHISFGNTPMYTRGIRYHLHLFYWCIGAGRTLSLDARFEKRLQRLKLDRGM